MARPIQVLQPLQGINALYGERPLGERGKAEHRLQGTSGSKHSNNTRIEPLGVLQVLHSTVRSRWVRPLNGPYKSVF